MINYNFELTEKVDQNMFNDFIETSKKSICETNGDLNFNHLETLHNKPFNNYIGTLERYSITKGEDIIGNLEGFIDRELNYINIDAFPKQ